MLGKLFSVSRLLKFIKIKMQCHMTSEKLLVKIRKIHPLSRKFFKIFDKNTHCNSHFAT